MSMEDENIFKDGVQTPLFSTESKNVVSLEKEDPEAQQIPIDEEKEEEEEEKDEHKTEEETAAQTTEHGIFIPFVKGQPRDLGNNNDPGTEYGEARTRRRNRKR
jgi:hypothetical protein